MPERIIYRRDSPKLMVITDIVMHTVVANALANLSCLRSAVTDCLGISVSKELAVLVRNGFTRKRARFYGQPSNLPLKTTTFLQQRDTLLKSTTHQIVSIDETSFGRHTGVAYGYSKCGSKVFIKKAFARVTTCTVVACVSAAGLVHKKAMPNSCNTGRFLEFLNECKLEQNTVVLLDNVSFHHSQSVQSWAVANGVTLLFTPPYSPWFNPIEMCFSIVKREYYKGTSCIDTCFSTLKPEHCQAFFDKSLACRDMF